MKHNIVFLLTLLLLLLNCSMDSVAQDTLQKRFFYGIQSHAYVKLKEHFFSYSIGVAGRYKLSDSSRSKLQFGLLYARRGIADSRGWICCPIPCPWSTLSYSYIELPVLLQYDILKNRDRDIMPMIEFGFVPAFLILGTKKYFPPDEYEKAERIEHYSIFKGYNSSFRPAIDFELVLGIGTDIRVKKYTLNLGVKTQFGPKVIVNSGGLFRRTRSENIPNSLLMAVSLYH